MGYKFLRCEPQVGKVTLFKSRIGNMNLGQTTSEFTIINLFFLNLFSLTKLSNFKSCYRSYHGLDVISNNQFQWCLGCVLLNCWIGLLPWTWVWACLSGLIWSFDLRINWIVAMWFGGFRLGTGVNRFWMWNF